MNPNNTASDLIKVNGTATLQSGAGLNVVKVTPGEYSLNSRYTVLTATNGLTGTYNGSIPFTVSGVPIARDAAVLEFGVQAPVARNAVLDVSYAGQMGSGVRDNGIHATLNWKF